MRGGPRNTASNFARKCAGAARTARTLNRPKALRKPPAVSLFAANGRSQYATCLADLLFCLRAYFERPHLYWDQTDFARAGIFGVDSVLCFERKATAAACTGDSACKPPSGRADYGSALSH